MMNRIFKTFNELILLFNRLFNSGLDILYDIGLDKSILHQLL